MPRHAYGLLFKCCWLRGRGPWFGCPTPPHDILPRGPRILYCTYILQNSRLPCGTYLTPEVAGGLLGFIHLYVHAAARTSRFRHCKAETRNGAKKSNSRCLILLLNNSREHCLNVCVCHVPACLCCTACNYWTICLEMGNRAFWHDRAGYWNHLALPEPALFEISGSKSSIGRKEGSDIAPAIYGS